MMKIVFIILLITGLASSNITCQKKLDSFEINQILNTGKSFYVKDSTQYSPEFIQELRSINSEYDSVRLIGNELVLSQSESYKLPTELPINKKVIYQSVKDSNQYELTLNRQNYTTIDYEFRLNNELIKKGQVLLSTGFIFGEETSEDFSTGEIYTLNQYTDKKGNWTCIQIEIGSGNRAELSYAIDSIQNIMEIPTLRKK